MTTTAFIDGSTLSAAAWANDVDTLTYNRLTTPAGTNTITGTGPASMTAYAAGQIFTFIPANTNTGATTLNITPSGASALGAKNVFATNAAMVGGEIRQNVPVMVWYDGTQFQLLASAAHANLAAIPDNLFTLQDNADRTKQLQFQVSGITTATTRTLTAPDENDTIAGIASTQTLTNKTLGAVTLAGTVSGGGQQLNNIIIGTVTPLAGSFTTLSTSDKITITDAAGDAILMQTASANASTVNIGQDSTSGYFQVSKSGSGTQLPMDLYVGGTAELRLGTTAGSSRIQNGIRIGADSTNNLLDDASNGAGAVALFIGNTQITAVSDMRLKTDICDTERDALGIFRNLRVVDHGWNDPNDQGTNNRNSRGRWTGLIAQEADRYIPWIVNRPRLPEHEDFMWQMDFNYMAPLFVKGFQQVIERLNALEKQ